MEKTMPDYIARRLSRHHWKLLRPVPAWDGVLYYDPLDIQLDRPLTFYRRLHHRRLGDIIYPVKSWKKDVKIWQRKHGCNAKPMFREYITITRKGTKIHLYVAQLTMHCIMGFTIADPRHWVVDHIDGDSMNNRPSNLQVITQSANLRRSEKVVEQARKNLRKIRELGNQKRNDRRVLHEGARIARRDYENGGAHPVPEEYGGRK
jgi:hypothetical protein